MTNNEKRSDEICALFNGLTFSDSDEPLEWLRGQITEALNAAQAEGYKQGAGSEWQPIATAPKDGTAIDIYVDYPEGGERYPDACFDKDEGYFCWTIVGSGKRIVFSATPPTHWMPLPPAPKGEE